MALSSIMCQNFVTFCGTQDSVKETCGSNNEDVLKDFPSLQICMHRKGKSLDHWEMKLHCERVAFPRIEPKLHSTSREACFYWHLYTAAAKHLPLYQKGLNHALQRSLLNFSSCQHFERMIRSGQDKTCVCLSKELLRLDTFDQVDRRNIVNKLERLLQMQSTLESVCLEGLSLSGDEGVRLLLALHSSRKTMKYLYCWRAFARTKASQMIQPDTDCESGCYETTEWKKCDLLRAIACFESLTTLSVNYAYIATPTGDLLVNLSKALGAKWQWLQLLCTEDDIDGKHLKCSEYCTSLPATTWSTMKHWSPELKVQYSIVNVPEYDRLKRFFAKTTPVHTFALSTSTSQKSRQRYFTDCTMKILYAWYADTLVYLHLHFWHQRDDMDSHLEKLFLRLPALRVFEFAGEVRRLKPLCAMSCQIRTGQCNVYSVNMQLQKVIHADIDNEELVKSIHRMLKSFREDFTKLTVKFLVSYVDD